MRLAYDVSPKVAGLLSRQTFDGDVRHYLRIGGTGLLATRLRGFKSMGDFPEFQYFGGNGDLRGYDYLEFAGSNMVYANAELRYDSGSISVTSAACPVVSSARASRTVDQPAPTSTTRRGFNIRRIP